MENKKNNFKIRNGFSLLELLIIVGALAILMILAVPSLNFFKKESALMNNAEEIISGLRVAQTKTLASTGPSQWGVYFNNVSSPHQYVLFKGSSYAGRDASFDEVYKLPAYAEFYEINLNGGGKEIVFSRISGATSQYGNVKIKLTTDASKNKIISVDSSGRIILGEEANPSDLPSLTDSRHIHFNYDRTINTASESLTLTFQDSPNPDTITTIPIASNMQSGQIFWQGTVNVNGSNQKIKIHTHKLNSADTQFSVHRDLRYNNKALTVDISGDTSGSLLNYSAAGIESRGASVYLTSGAPGNPQRQ